MYSTSLFNIKTFNYMWYVHKSPFLRWKIFRRHYCSERPVRKADNLPPSCAVVTKSGSLNFLELLGLSRPEMGLLYLYLYSSESFHTCRIVLSSNTCNWRTHELYALMPICTHEDTRADTQKQVYTIKIWYLTSFVLIKSLWQIHYPLKYIHPQL